MKQLPNTTDSGISTRITYPLMQEARRTHSSFLKIAIAAVLVLMLVFSGAAAADIVVVSDPIELLYYVTDDDFDVILAEDIPLTETLSISTAGTLDLNGHVLSNTGSGSVIRIESTGNLTVKDESTTDQYFTFVENGSWTLDTTAPASSVDLADFNLTDAKAATAGTYHVKVTGGVITGSSEEYGGGVCVDGGTFEMKSGNVIGNSATDDGSGGGVFVNSGTFTMSGGSITGNSANFGGGVYVLYGTFSMSDFASISGNSAMYGGGVCVDGDSFEMKSGSVVENSAYGGGGVFVNSGMFTMSSGNITGNSANFGGGVYVLYGTFSMSGSASISGNSANEGGGVQNAGLFTMSGNAKITGNSATNNGSGVYIEGGTFNVSGSPVISGNTVGEAANNVYLAGENNLKLVAPFTGEIRITTVNSVELAAGKQFGLAGDDVSGADCFIADEQEGLIGKVDGENLVWAEKPQSTQEPVPAADPTQGTPIAQSVNPQQTSASPMPVAGLIAGLGAAGLLFGLRRK